MLPPTYRMRRSTEFSFVVRSGSRARRGSLVVHQVVGSTQATPQVGLIVGKGVGGSVVRHRVSRRLRAQLALRLQRLPAGSSTVIRALPAAGSAASRDLAADLDAALRRLAGAR